MDPSPLLTVHPGVIGDGAVVATAIHAGHDLRPEIAAEMTLAEAIRTRERGSGDRPDRRRRAHARRSCTGRASRST